MRQQQALRSLWISVLTLLGTVGTAWSAENTNPAVLPEVLVTGKEEKNTAGSYKVEAPSLPKYTQTLRDTPQSITTIPKQILEDQHTTTMRDAVRNVAGISIAAGEGGFQGDSVTLRGFSARNDIFLDGMRDFGSYHRDTFNWESVEILRGPASVSFGRGSTGGVLNQVSKAPHQDAEKSVELSLGSNSGQRLSLDINEPLGKDMAFRLNAVEETAAVAGRNVVDINHWGVAPSLAWGLGTDTRVTLAYLHQSQKDVPDYGIPWLYHEPAPVDRENYYGFQDDFLNTEADIFTLKIDHDISETMTLRDQLRYGNYTRAMRASAAKTTGTFTPDTDVDDISVTRSEINTQSTETVLQNQLDLTTQFKLGDTEHTFLIGVEASRETSSPTRYTITDVPGTNLGNPDENDTFTGTYTAPRIVTATSETIGIYTLDTVKLNEQWELVGGVRWDQFKTHYIQEGSLDLTAKDTFTSLRGALVYKPVEEGSIYLGYGNSFNPSAEALSLSTGNVDLAPEENKTYELGTKWDLLNKKLLVRAALFHTDKLNARETANSVTTLSGHHQVRGFEIETAGQITPEWQLTMGYAHTKSEVISSDAFPDTEGEPLANAPLQTLTLWTTYRLPWNLTVGMGGNYMDSRRASATAPFDTTTGLAKEAPSYWLWNAMMSYQFNTQTTLQLNVYNLADTLYYDQVYSGHVVPGAGRTYVASLKFDF